jgi:hypothetical protein
MTTVPAPYGIPQNSDYNLQFGHLLAKLTPEQRTMMYVFNITPGTNVDFGDLERAINASRTNPSALSAAEQRRLRAVEATNLQLSGH